MYLMYLWFLRYFENGVYVSGKVKKLGAQPKGIASRGDFTAIATLKSLILMDNDTGSSVRATKS